MKGGAELGKKHSFFQRLLVLKGPYSYSLWWSQTPKRSLITWGTLDIREVGWSVGIKREWGDQPHAGRPSCSFPRCHLANRCSSNGNAGEKAVYPI